MTTRLEWAHSFLTMMGFPTSPDNITAVIAWACGENTSAAWNPLATTMPAAGATAFNSVGVRNYPDQQTGLDATAATLRLSYYDNIRALFVDGASADRICAAVAASPWGTHDAVAALTGLRENPDLANIEVAGSPSTASPPPAPPAPVPPAEPARPAEVTVQLPELSVALEAHTEETVATCQVLLNSRAGAGLAVDGQFGPRTETAVKAFQARSGLSVDGIVGVHTWGSLLGAPQ